NVVVRAESLVQCRQRRVGAAAEFLVDRADHGEGVGIEAEPYVQAMFLDALAEPRIASARAFAAQAPALLVDGDLVALAPIGLGAQKKRGRQRAGAAAEDGDFLDLGHRFPPGVVRKRASVEAACRRRVRLHQPGGAMGTATTGSKRVGRADRELARRVA